MVRNVELKLLCSTISKLWGWQNSKAWQFPLCWIACGEAGFDSTGGNVKWYNTYGEEFEDILSNYIIFVPQSNSPTSRNSTWRYKLKKQKCSNNMHMNKMNHWSIICSCKHWKLTQAFLGKCMNLVECYAAIKKNEGGPY